MSQKQNEISNLPRLSPELMENIFHVYKEKDTGRYYYNLLQSIEFPKDLPPSFFTFYTFSYEDTWPLISYKHYETPNLWWLIILANNITNPTKFPEVGTTLLIPTIDTANLVIQRINS